MLNRFSAHVRLRSLVTIGKSSQAHFVSVFVCGLVSAVISDLKQQTLPRRERQAEVNLVSGFIFRKVACVGAVQDERQNCEFEVL